MQDTALSCVRSRGSARDNSVHNHRGHISMTMPLSSEALDQFGRGYLRLQLRRKRWISLNGDWQFAIDRDGSYAGPDAVPWMARIVVPFAPEAPASTIGDPSF